MEPFLRTKQAFEIFSYAVGNEINKNIRALDILYNNNDKFIESYLEEETQKLLKDVRAKNPDQTSGDEIYSLTKPINDYFGYSHETSEVLSHYMIVGAFSFFERGLKKLLTLTGNLTPAQLRSCYRKDDLVLLLKSKFQIEYHLLAAYTEIEELRCLNNAIKHQGYVDTKLVASNNKWVLDSEITNTYDDYTRLCDAPKQIIEELSAKINLALFP